MSTRTRPGESLNNAIPTKWTRCSKHTVLAAVFGVLAAFFVTLFAAAPVSAQAPKAERPTYTVGDKWIRSDGAYDLIRIENGRYVFAADGGREVHLTRDLGIARIVRGGQVVLELEPPASPTWPLEVGQWGVSWLTLKSLDPQYGQSVARLSWKVDAYEDVRVPAGTFKAFRIAQVLEPRFLAASPQARRVELVFWYAPAIQQLVRADGNDLSGFAFQAVALDRPAAAPLAVSVMEPKDESRVTAERATLTGKVTGGAGALRIAVTLNGAEIARQQEASAAGKDLPLSVPLKLSPGKNTLIVTVTDGSGASRQEGRVLFYDKPTPAVASATPAAPASPRPAAPPASPPSSVPPATSVAPPAATALAPRAPVTAPPASGTPSAAVPSPTSPAPAPSPPRVAGEPPQATPPVAAPATPPAPPAATVPAPAPATPPPAVAAAPARTAPAPTTPSAATTPPAPTAAPAPPPASTPTTAAPTPASPPAVAALPSDASKSLPAFRIAISTPTNQARVNQDSVTFAAVVHGGSGVRQVLITANGVELWKQENRSQQPSMAVNLPVKLVEGQNTLVVTAAENDGTMHQEIRTVHLEKLVPLALDVRYPEDRSRVADEASVVAAVARSSKGVSRITVALNGVEVHQQEERSAQKSVAVSAPLTLRDGPNAIVVTAVEPDGTTRQEVRTVILDRPKPAAPLAAPAAPAPPPPPPATQWAVVIGVGGYEHSGVPKLRYPVADADAVYQTLLASGGFKKENILLLTDKTERRPTLRNIKWALGTFLARSAHKDDLVVIYFAGHGASEVDQRGVERDGLSKYLVPIDADPDDLYSSALPMDEMQNVLQRIEAERVTVFLDACYSGAAGGRTFASTKTRGVTVDDVFLDRLTRSKGRAIVTASRPAEVSIELPDLGHGVFTYYLVRGLQGYADLNRDGIVSLQEIYEYLAQEVSKKSRAVGGNQHPMLKGELEGIIPLTKIGKRN
ncbi:MAG TPA: caspase family protein [Methylomirabilota bacterium]|nr:caspase family protein [Methylomirabilota bacterium]